jgi:type III secretory pathway component EscT
MDKDLNPLLHFQILVAIWALIGVSIGFVMTCVFYFLNDKNSRKRPGINIREL